MTRYPGRLERALNDSFDYERKLKDKIKRLEDELEACHKYENALNAELVQVSKERDLLVEDLFEIETDFCEDLHHPSRWQHADECREDYASRARAALAKATKENGDD